MNNLYLAGLIILVSCIVVILFVTYDQQQQIISSRDQLLSDQLKITRLQNQLMDLIGTNETKQEWIKHYCGLSTNSTDPFKFPFDEFCNDVIQKGAGYLGFNQTGGFLGE